MSSPRQVHPVETVPPWEKIAAFVFGVIFVSALLVLAVVFPDPTPFQYNVFRIVLSLACAGIAAVIPGLLSVRTDAPGIAIRAGGAIAVFVVVYLFNPAQLVATPTSVVQHSKGPNSSNIQGVQGPVTIIQPAPEPQQEPNKP